MNYKLTNYELINFKPQQYRTLAHDQATPAYIIHGFYFHYYTWPGYEKYFHAIALGLHTRIKHSPRPGLRPADFQFGNWSIWRFGNVLIRQCADVLMKVMR